jgi:heme-degrading monooxygenase HmoA
VIFSSLRSAGENGYGHMADRMVELATGQPGFLGVESVRATDGFGITVSYWTSLQAIANWRSQAEHRIAQETGKTLWYQHYELRIARVERAYGKRT